MTNIQEQFIKIRQHTETLCKHLSTEDYTLQATTFTSPPKWHLAHTTWFFETMILKKNKHYKAYNQDYNFLFNSYYNSLGERIERSDRGHITRPNIDEVLEYRKIVDEKIQAILMGNISKTTASMILLGLQHEQQHQELLITDLKYSFSKNPIYPAYCDVAWVGDEEKDSSAWLSVPEGLYDIGHKGDGFCFDNELANHKVFIENFNISKCLVKNREYLEFIQDGGYNKPLLWLDDGWKWLMENKIKCPLYWKLLDNTWYYYTLAGLQPINLNAILSHVSFYEADAYAVWKGSRLPTEFEWEVAAPDINYKKRWEWTNSSYLPYPRYKKKQSPLGEYNGKFMANQMVLRGGSVATPLGHHRITYRNFHYPDTQWQFSGIRLARDV